ncbi:MAG TPA: hypothetical protein PLI86_00295 [bacterium]|nr:hypothetical protein [bacterium]
MPRNSRCRELQSSAKFKERCGACEGFDTYVECMRGRTRKGCHACDRRREIAADPAQADYENAGAAFSDSVI